MDRESELIKAVTDLVKIISDIQDNIRNLTTTGYLMKDRIEKLEERVFPYKGGLNGS